MLMFFGKATVDEQLRANNGYLKVILGQTFGFTIVVLISLIGLLIGAVVPKEYVDLVGIFPFLVGLYKMYEVFMEEGCFCCCFGRGGGEHDPINKASYETLPQAEDAEAGAISASKKVCYFIVLS
jgi:hypothetical protein